MRPTPISANASTRRRGHCDRPYAAELIDEFFAVSCEVFFAEPELLRAEYPAYYAQLMAYFGVDPEAGWLLR